jgi:hypothetical protein
LIDAGVGLASANAITMATAGSNVGNFLLDGWFGRSPSQATNNSWELSLKELVSGFTGGSFGIANNYTYQGKVGVNAVVRRNLAVHGASSLATLILAPVAGRAIKKLARTPIRQFNKIWKDTGLMSATGVKI